jgi:hypothetical protein
MFKISGAIRFPATPMRVNIISDCTATCVFHKKSPTAYDKNSCWSAGAALSLGFPFNVKKLFTRNIVTDVTNGYYVVITVVTA